MTLRQIRRSIGAVSTTYTRNAVGTHDGSSDLIRKLFLRQFPNSAMPNNSGAAIRQPLAT